MSLRGGNGGSQGRKGSPPYREEKRDNSTYFKVESKKSVQLRTDWTGRKTSRF